jgi:hypothetical protein
MKSTRLGVRWVGAAMAAPAANDACFGGTLLRLPARRVLALRLQPPGNSPRTTSSRPPTVNGLVM